MQEPRSIRGAPGGPRTRHQPPHPRIAASHPSPPSDPPSLTVLDLSMRRNLRAPSTGAGAGPGNGSWAWRGEGAEPDRPGCSHPQTPPRRPCQAHPRQGPRRLLPVWGAPRGPGLLAEPRLRGAVHALGPLRPRLPRPRPLRRRPRGGARSGQGGLLLPVPPRLLGAEEEKKPWHSQSGPEPEPEGGGASHRSRYLPPGLGAALLGWDTPTRLGGCLHLADPATTHVRNSPQQSHGPRKKKKKLPGTLRPSSNHRRTGA